MEKNIYQENELLSIIIPVYNTEKYLDRCISSILNQTYANLEVIVINDGSTDNSLKICQKWKENDSRVVLINKENTGVSDSRNCGLEIAKGKYIAFVDSDDYIEKNMYEELIASMKNYKADLITCAVSIIKNNTTVKTVNNYKGSLNKQEFLQILANNSGDFIFNKLMKKEIIGELRFYNNISYGEDLFFLYKYIERIENVFAVDKPLYNYNTTNESSISHTATSVDYMKNIEADYYLNKLLEKNDIYNLDKRANAVCNYVLYKKNIDKNFDCSKYERIVKEYIHDGLIFKVKGVKNKIKVFLAYYMKWVYLALKNKNDII